MLSSQLFSVQPKDNKIDANAVSEKHFRTPLTMICMSHVKKQQRETELVVWMEENVKQ
jgi:uncharacterized protein YueI